MIKKYLLLYTVVCQSLAISQPLISNDKCEYTNKKYGVFSYENQYTLLPWENYPWGVCLESFDLTDKEKEWTRLAMRFWNEGYKKYAKKRATEIPQLKDYKILFIETCDKTTRNIIDVKKAYLSWEAGRYVEENTFARWKLEREVSLFKKSCSWEIEFLGSIELQNRYEWSSHFFLNVMMHELGHALGIPHLPPWAYFLTGKHTNYVRPSGTYALQSEKADLQVKRC